MVTWAWAKMCLTWGVSKSQLVIVKKGLADGVIATFYNLGLDFKVEILAQWHYGVVRGHNAKYAKVR